MPNPKLTRDCAYCGKTFSKPDTCSMTEWNTQRKYCSYVCYWKAKPKPSKPCAVCGKPFHREGTKGKYCSHACQGLAQSKPLPLCEICGKQTHKRGRRFCSPECKGKWYKGENVYNYLGGQARDHYASAFWLKRAQEIRDRDKVCQRCKKPPAEGETLSVHHIIPWRVSQDDSPENLIALCISCHKIVDAAIINST